MNIVLTGMAGSGKSTLGKLLAETLNMPFYDSDEEISRKHGEIPIIFARHGEAFFRALESEVIRELAAKRNVVIATGGGVILSPVNIAELKREGMLIYLQASPAKLLANLAGDDYRPLLAGDKEERISTLLTARARLYEQSADFIVNADEPIAAVLASLLSKARP